MVRYLETLFRHRLLFALPVAVILAVSGGALMVQPPIYTATVRLWVDRPVLGPDENNPYLAPAAEQASSLQELLKTRYFCTRVAYRGPLADYLASRPLPQGTLDRLRGLLHLGATTRRPSAAEVDDISYDLVSKNVTAVAAGPQIVQVDVIFGDPRVAAGTAQAVVEQFLEERLASRKARAQVTVDFYSSQLKSAQSTLAAADGAVSSYLAAHPELGAANAVPDARLTELNRADARARDSFTGLSQKLDSANLDLAALSAPGASGFRLLDPATAPTRASISKRVLVQVLGAGLGLATVIVVLGLIGLTLADTTLRRPDEVEPALGLRLVASTPRVRAGAA